MGLKQPLTCHILMLTIKVKEINQISQKSYDSVIDSLELCQLPCPSCQLHGNLIYHGSYSRTVKACGERLTLVIQRVLCTNCHHTHALMISGIVPYSQIPLAKQAEIISRSEEGAGLDDVLDTTVDENNAKAVVRSYRKHWRERLQAEQIPIWPLCSLVCQCFAHFARPFMQVHRTINALFVRPT